MEQLKSVVYREFSGAFGILWRRCNKEVFKEEMSKEENEVTCDLNEFHHEMIYFGRPICDTFYKPRLSPFNASL